MRRRTGVGFGVGVVAVGGLVLALPFLGAAVATVGTATHWLRHASLAEIAEYVEFGRYVQRTYQDMHYDPDRGHVTFARALADADATELELAIRAFHAADFQQAIRRLETWQDAHGTTEESLFWLALAHLRAAEEVNCLDAPEHGDPGHARHRDHRHPVDLATLCTLPLVDFHRDPTHSELASATLLRLLEDHPDDLRYRWLLNFSQMTIDRFPDGVPERYRVSGPFVDLFYGPHRDALVDRYAALALTNVAEQLGVGPKSSGKGTVVEDLNGDGHLDIVAASLYGPMQLYLGDGRGGFTHVPDPVGLSDFGTSHVMTGADFDGDGDVDLFISRGLGDGHGGYALMANDGAARFTDVTRAVGLLDPPPGGAHVTYAWMSAWGDIDNDGDLDVFVALQDEPALESWKNGAILQSSRLYRNDGAMFTDVTEAWGLGGFFEDDPVVSAAFGDYDGDGDVDLLTSAAMPGYRGAFRNVDGERFEHVDLLEPPAGLGFMVSWVDLDHDGRLDVFYGVNGTADQAYRANLGPPEGRGDLSALPINRLYLQQPDGTFRDRSDLWGDRVVAASMGVNFGDINNDGAYDFYLGTGNPEVWYTIPNLFYVGQVEADGSIAGRMENISGLFGLGTIRKGHGIVFFDHDGDGDQDLYSSLGGAWPSDPWFNAFFLNESVNGNRWVKFRLRGTRANRMGLGAQSRIVAVDAAGREIVRTHHMDNQTGFGSAPYLAHVGLGEAVRIDRVEVRWPGDPVPQVFHAELDGSHTFVQR